MKRTSTTVTSSTAAVAAYLVLFTSLAVAKSARGEDAGAEIAVRGVGEVDTFALGAKVFTNRPYVVAECPDFLKGEKLLRSGIEWVDFECTRPGTITILARDPVDKTAKRSSRYAELEAAGFGCAKEPVVFQLFGNSPYDRARVYAKRLKKGERFQLTEWAVVVGFSGAEFTPFERKPWTNNEGELLYNGIRLPKEWPPKTIVPYDMNPMPVPYLDHPPETVPIDVGRQLFVDDFLIEKTDLARTYHLAKKYEGNPILEPETELEMHRPRNAIACPKDGGVWWDSAEQLFKMWYEAGWIHTMCYATSKDGIHWDRPDLDIEPGTNRVLPKQYRCDSWNVVPDYDTDDPEQRYKIFIMPGGNGRPAMSMVSADGVHFSEPVMTGITGDRSSMFYNPFRKKWVYSLRDGWRERSRRYWEHSDFLAGAKWKAGEPVLWLAADNRDPPDPEIGDRAQLYNQDAVAYESIMLGIFEIHLGPHNDVCRTKGLPKITELNLAYSRDGFHWSRPDRRPFIRAERRDVWDRGYVQPVGGICTIRGDTLWFYYSGFRGNPERLERSSQFNGMYYNGSTGVAFMRRDGFVSLDAKEKPGEVLTRPVRFTGKYLFVNADVDGGALKAEVVDEDGKPIEPFTLANCNPISVDATLEQITWRDGSDLSSLKDRPVRFRFRLENGSLYAFWVSRDTSGRSDGYVAAGGPGYTGPIDTVGRKALEAEKWMPRP